jgi:glycosyltransferase involved in cell wall biosynthesis
MLPMRVIQVHSGDIGGGAEAVARNHHHQMCLDGMTAQLLVARKQSEDKGVDQIPFVRGPKGLLRTARWLERNLGLQNVYSPAFRKLDQYFAFQPDVLHLHSLHGAESFADLAALPRLTNRYPSVMSLHDLFLMTGHCGHPLDCQRWKIGCGDCPDLTLYPAVSRDATRWNFRRRMSILNHCRLHLVVPSSWLKSQVQMSPILRHFPVTVVANPVDTSVFYPGCCQSIRGRYGISASDRTLLLIAQHLDNPYKGIGDGIAAINAVNLPNVKAIIVGHSADEVAQRINVPSVVLPFSSDPMLLADYYRMADVLLMPSRGETFGLVAAEAMSCGVPVVCPAVGGLTDVIGGNEGGILTPPRDSAAMARAIHLLLTDEELRLQLARAGRNRAVTLFCQKRHTENCLSVYQKVVAEFGAVG